MSGFRIRKSGGVSAIYKISHIISQQSTINGGVSSGGGGNSEDRNAIYSFKDDTYNVSKNIKCLTVTMVGGGGAGGTGSIKNGIFYGGGGGGAGGSTIKKPVIINNPDNANIRIETRIGRGGTILVNSGDGTDTVVCVYIDDKIVFRHTSYGGKGGGSTHSNNKGGKGGVCGTNEMFGGYDGDQGSVGMASVGKIFGGKGGNSAFEEGGLGANQKGQDTTDIDIYAQQDNSTNPKGQSGVMGSGGGGSIPGIDETGNGGDGFIIIEF